jgi:hypothetical protein
MRKNHNVPLIVSLIVSAIIALPTTSSAQIAARFTNNFEDGTTQGWAINLLGMGAPPAAALPTNIATGGPAGAGDHFLQLTSLGGGGAGSRLMALNPAGWGGNYLTAGIKSIRLNAINLGTTDLALRFAFEDPTTGPPTNIAMSAQAQMLTAGSGWQSLEFPLYGSTGMAALLGTVNGALSATTVVRLFHSPTFELPPTAIAAQLGVDNITASVSVVPEPSTFALLAVGGMLLIAFKYRTRI